MNRTSLLLTTLLLLHGSWLAHCARGQEAPKAIAWELQPYRIELCVIVEPSPRLPAGYEADLATQLTAQCQAANGGPWQVASNQKPAAHRTRLLRELPIPDPPAALEASPGIDKVILVSLRERNGQFQMVAREWDAIARLWNVPVIRSVAQNGGLAAEALSAVQAAFGQLALIDQHDANSTTIRLRASAVPRRDGSYFSADRDAVFRPFLVQTDKQGQPQPATSTVVPSVFLTPVTTPGAISTSAGKGTTIKCLANRVLTGDYIPAYHPLQLRLAVGLAKSTEPIRVRVVDVDDPKQPLEGYEIRTRPLASAAGANTDRQGTTNRQGEFVLKPTTPLWISVSQGGEPLQSRPVVPGLQSELVIPIKNDRQRLELAASVAELNDDLLDTLSRQVILDLRAAEALKKRDISLAARLSTELKNNGSNPQLPARLAELEKQSASLEPVAREQLKPALDQAKTSLERLKETIAKLP